MTINIYEANMTRRTLIDTAPTFVEAKAKVAAMGVAFMEDDEDHADCADAYTNDGRVIAIQPEGFTLEKRDANPVTGYKDALDALRREAGEL